MLSPVAERSQLPGLDGVRALSVIAVIWHHTHPGVGGWPITRHGFLGVDAFFVLSGFLITTLLLRERARTGHISLKNFYARRALRIFPLYYLVLAVLALYFGLMARGSSQAPLFFSELPYHLSFTSNWADLRSFMAITWSLATEEQFYLLFPLLLVLLGRGVTVFLMLALLLNQWVNFGAADAALNAVGLHRLHREILQITFTPILLGVTLAWWLQPRFDGLSRWAQAHDGLGAGVTGAAVLVLVLAANWPGDISGAPRLLIHLLMTAALAAILVWPRSLWVRALAWRPLAYIGSISYGMYLLHMLCRDAGTRMLAKLGLQDPLWLFALCLVLTMAMASLSFRYFERYWLGLRSRFRDTPARR